MDWMDSFDPEIIAEVCNHNIGIYKRLKKKEENVKENEKVIFNKDIIMEVFGKFQAMDKDVEVFLQIEYSKIRVVYVKRIFDEVERVIYLKNYKDSEFKSSFIKLLLINLILSLIV